jgi:hypothetical protein
MKQTLLIVSFLFTHCILQAQVIDNFTDGDFSQNPIWSGDVANYVVSGDSLRSNSSTLNDTLYLSTPSAIALQGQWEIYVRLNFSTSSTNYVDVYLMSDISNLRQTQNGYFVRLGNTSDDICLYKVVNGTKTIILDGVNASLSSSDNKVRLKVTRDAGNNWTLLREVNGNGSSFVSEGSVIDASVNSTSYFGVFVKQSTASFFKKHWFDNINVGNIIIDTTAPQLLSAAPTSVSTLDVDFDESLDNVSATNVLNYSVDNGLGAPLSASIDANDASLVHLNFSGTFTAGIDYQLTVNSVKDIAQNTIAANAQVVFYLPKMFDVVINEVMADPTPVVGLPDAEYVELFNASNHAVNLAGWKLQVGTSQKILPNYSLAPGAFVLLVNPTSAGLYSNLSNVIVPTGLSTTSLTNSGTTLTLFTANNVFMHQVSYTDQWYLDASKVNGGWSLEQIDPANPCAGASNWRASIANNGGTPGVVNSIHGNNPDVTALTISAINIIGTNALQVVFNEWVQTSNLNLSSIYTVDNGIGNPSSVSVISGLSNAVTLNFTTDFVPNIIYHLTVSALVNDCVGNAQVQNLSSQFSLYNASAFDVVFTEIMADPDPAQGLPNVEYLELFNRTAFPINLTNWKFVYGSTEKTIAAGIIQPLSYALITSPANAIALQSIANFNVISIPDLSNSFLTNSGTNLLLQDSLGHDISFASYADTWYNDASKVNGGWSLEKVDVSNYCAGKENWKACVNENGGTPGVINSVNASNPDNTAPTIKNICVLDSVTIQVDFNELVAATSIANAAVLVDNGAAVQQVLFENNYANSMQVKLQAAMNTNTTYTLNISTAFLDCNANQSAAVTNYSFSQSPASLYSLLINEIMADPSPVVSNLPEAEFIELFNKNSFPVNLNGYTLINGSSQSTLGCATIAPNEYLIICNSNDADQFSSYGKTLGSDGFSISNSGQFIQLKNQMNDVVSTVNFTDAWYKDTYKKDGGWSIEQIDPNNPCGGESNWKASTNTQGATPGKINSVNGNNSDATSPELLRALVVAPNKLRLFFSETLIGSSTKDLAMYQVNNGIGQATAVSVTGVNASDLILSFANNFVVKTIYTITVSSNITDCVGNQLQANSMADFAVAEVADSADVLINEILYNPETDGYDFVEIYNNSSKVIDLKSLRMANLDTLVQTPTAVQIIDSIGYLIFPGQYYVLTEKPSDIQQRYTVLNKKNFVQVANLPTLSISAGSFAICKPNLQLLDYTIYTDAMQFPLLASSKGVSLERISFTRRATDIGNWHSAAQTAGYATPTGINSQFSIEKTSDDFITLSKDIFSPDNDSYDDVLQISLNPGSEGKVSSIDVYNQRGVLVKNIYGSLLLGSSNNIVTWDGTNLNNEKCDIGAYVILVTVFDVAGNVKRYKKSVVVAAKL